MALTSYPGVVNWEENQLPNLYNDPLWLASYGVGRQGANKASEVLSGSNADLNSVYKRLLDTTLETERKTAAASGLTGASEMADRLSKAAERVGSNWALTEPEIASKYQGLATTPTNQLINWTNALRKENRELDTARDVAGNENIQLGATALGTLLSDLLGVKTTGTGTTSLAGLAGSLGAAGLKALYSQIFGGTMTDAQIDQLVQSSTAMEQSTGYGLGTDTGGGGAGAGGGLGVETLATAPLTATQIYQTLISAGVPAAQAQAIAMVPSAAAPSFDMTLLGPEFMQATETVAANLGVTQEVASQMVSAVTSAGVSAATAAEMLAQGSVMVAPGVEVGIGALAGGAEATAIGAGATGALSGFSAFALPAAAILNIIMAALGMSATGKANEASYAAVEKWMNAQRESYNSDIGRLVNEAARAVNSGGWGSQLLEKYIWWGAQNGQWARNDPLSAARSLITEMENTGQISGDFRAKFESALRNTEGTVTDVHNAMQNAATGTWRQSETYPGITPAQDKASQNWTQVQAQMPGVLGSGEGAVGATANASEIEQARASLGYGVGRRVFEEVLPQADNVQQALAQARDAEWRALPEYKQQYEAAGGAQSGWLPPMA